MKEDILYNTPAWIICFLLAIAIIVTTYAGRHIRQKTYSNEVEFKTVENAILALFGLLMAFTFSMAGTRYDNRREVTTEEANTISTAIMMADMYPDSARKVFHTHFKNYLETRIAYYQLKNAKGYENELTLKKDSASMLLWAHATALSKRDDISIVASNQMIPALNAMFDISVTQSAVMKARVPNSIIILLLVMGLISGFFIGFSTPVSTKSEPFSIIGFSLLSAIVIFVILDLDRPFRGLINVTEYSKDITALRALFQ